MRTLYDSTTPSVIPRTAAMVAGYLPPSRYAWSDADWARFPTAVHVRIAVRASTPDGHVLDVEMGDATPAQAPGWVKARRAAGADPTIYCSVSLWPTVRAAFTAAGVAQPHYWIAHYDGDPTIPVGAVAKQHIDPPGSGGHWDLSVVADHWPGVDPAPTPLEVPEMELTDKLNPNPPQGTVNEALNAVLPGQTGLRSAGPLALNVANALHAINTVSAQVAAIAGALPANQAQLLAAIAAHSTGGTSIADLETAFAAVLGEGFDVSITPKAAG